MTARSLRSCDEKPNDDRRHRERSNRPDTRLPRDGSQTGTGRQIRYLAVSTIVPRGGPYDGLRKIRVVLRFFFN